MSAEGEKLKLREVDDCEVLTSSLLWHGVNQ